VPDKQLDDSEYIRFRNFLEQQCGIVLGSNKLYLVKSRLGPLMNRFDVTTLSELIVRTLKPHERQLRAAVVDAMTTNETLWFRDTYPFDLFKKKLLPEMAEQKRQVKVWSAASSSGQEPYSLAMCIDEFTSTNPRAGLNASIVGTDISNTMLEHCKLAQYDALALARGLSAERKRKYFQDCGRDMMQVKENIRRLTNFRHLNLLDSYTLLGRFDIIFCRNVLIYFAPEIKSQIINKFANSLNNNGYLVLGASESMSGLSDRFNMVRCNPGLIYQKK
jgi:chemotaxis protein methyltransferase CheR